jgi:hypothetical protein
LTGVFPGLVESLALQKEGIGGKEKPEKSPDSRL